ncbi:MAG TPA: DUF4340 domain-containing protein [Thermodesulfobacteriota bacterium]|nr:DUF4340 domain-containing protein [Deltaproteobacteria bacterium]HNU72011.1 DUF4340 domain-containing protein [Thermodesulfobacteriota bacterium]HOC38287.1 DUF4340 domain-containing protein [Thermodesulfobacteriota bacterium]
MKARQNLILLIVLLISAGMILIVEQPFERKASRDTVSSDRLFPELRPGAVEELHIKQSTTETVEIRKQENRWVVLHDEKGYPANSHMVNQALEILFQLRPENVASEKKEKHDLFQVTREKGIEVIVLDSDGKEAAHLFIGSQGPDLYSTYIRKAGSDSVYRSDAFTSGIYDQPASTWRDTTLFSFDPKGVIELQIAREGETILLSKDTKGNWHIQEPVSSLAEPKVVEELIGGLASLQATDYADGIAAEESGVRTPQLRLSVMLEDGTRNELSIGLRQHDQPFFFVTTNQTEYLYVLHETIVERLSPPIQVLQQSEAASADTSKTDSEDMPAPDVPHPGR